MADLVAPMQSVLDPLKSESVTVARTGLSFPCSLEIGPTKFRLEGFPFGVNVDEWRFAFQADVDIHPGDYLNHASKGLFWIDRRTNSATLDVETVVAAARQRDAAGLIQIPTNISVTFTCASDHTKTLAVPGYLWPMLESAHTVYVNEFLQPWTFAFDGKLTYSNSRQVGQGDLASFTINGVTHMGMILENIREVLSPMCFSFGDMQEPMNNLTLTFTKSDGSSTTSAIPARGHQVAIPRPLTGDSVGSMQETFWFWAVKSAMVYDDASAVTDNDTINITGLASGTTSVVVRSITPDLERGLDMKIVVDVDV